MSIYLNWLKKPPKNPVKELAVFKNSVKRDQEFQKFIHSIDINDIREYWSIVSVICCWSCSLEVKKTVIKDLVMYGADIDIHGTCGLNCLHILILKIFFGTTKQEDIELFTHLVEKGADVHKKAFFNPSIPFINIITMSCVELVHVLLRDPNPGWISLLPKQVAIGKYATANELHWLTRFLDPQDGDEAFEIDRLIVQWKLPYPLPNKEVLARVAILNKYKDYIDIDDMRTTLATIKPEGEYLDSLMCGKDEFMLYEYVNYTDETCDKTFYFHKKMLPSIWKHKHNPYTRKEIPSTILNEWYEQISHRPIIYEMTTLEETIKNSNSIRSLRSNPIEDAYYFLHTLVLISHPYTNVLDIKNFTPPQFVHLSKMLVSSPFRLSRFSEIHLRQQDMKEAFIKIIFAYVMKENTNAVHNLHFALEECIQDFRMTDHIREWCTNHNIKFTKNSMFSVCDHIPDVNDLLLERIGTFDDNSFMTIWLRLCKYKDLMDHYASSSPSSSSSSSSSSPKSSDSSSSSSSNTNSSS
jgi:hypothetical protein